MKQTDKGSSHQGADQGQALVKTLPSHAAPHGEFEKTTSTNTDAKTQEAAMSAINTEQKEIKSKATKAKEAKNKDPKTLVTPFAFTIAPNVLYTPLASPRKRGLAMLIDGLLISVLAEQAGAMFIVLVLLTLFIERRSHQLGKVFKWGLYFAMLLMTVWVTSDNLIEYQRGTDKPATSSVSESPLESEGIKSLKLLPDILALSLCEQAPCAHEKLQTLLAGLETAELTQEEKHQVATQIVGDLSLTVSERDALQKMIDQRFPVVVNDISQALRPSGEAQDEVDLKEPMNDSPPLPVEPERLVKVEPLAIDEDDEADSSPYSLLKWAKGILNDLGLGFGWAAFYFTVFTAWFDGQTLGKKLMNIRVIQLDGSAISLWDSFGRYGGYGAGFATGLLGFLQIYWDANRQAIQDKISATVVVDLSKPREKSFQQPEVMIVE